MTGHRPSPGSFAQISAQVSNGAAIKAANAKPAQFPAEHGRHSFDVTVDVDHIHFVAKESATQPQLNQFDPED